MVGVKITERVEHTAGVSLLTLRMMRWFGTYPTSQAVVDSNSPL